MPSKKTFRTIDKSSGLYKTKQIIAISSCKGGVGKSTVAALLSLEMSRRGFKVGLLDVDLYGPSLPTLLGCYERPVLTENRQFTPLSCHGLDVMSLGFLIGKNAAIIRGPIATKYTQQLLHNTAWGDLDFLFIDMPPGTGDIHLTITQSVSISGSVIVTTRQALSLSDVERGICMFEKVNVPILGFIENMTHLSCCSCGTKNDLFETDKDLDLSVRFGRKTLAKLPLEKKWWLSPSLEEHSDVLRDMGDSFVASLKDILDRDSMMPIVEKTEKSLILVWKDKPKWTIPYRELRSICPCAYCVDELTGESRIVLTNIDKDLFPRNIQILGNYALSIEWSDGHSSGIYSYSTMCSIVSSYMVSTNIRGV